MLFVFVDADFPGATFEIIFVFLVANDDAVNTALLGVLEWATSVEDCDLFFRFEIVGLFVTSGIDIRAVVSNLVVLAVVVIVFVATVVVVFMIRVVGGINFMKSVGSETESKLYIFLITTISMC